MHTDQRRDRWPIYAAGCGGLLLCFACLVSTAVSCGLTPLSVRGNQLVGTWVAEQPLDNETGPPATLEFRPDGTAVYIDLDAGETQPRYGQYSYAEYVWRKLSPQRVQIEPTGTQILAPEFFSYMCLIDGSTLRLRNEAAGNPVSPFDRNWVRQKESE